MVVAQGRPLKIDQFCREVPVSPQALVATRAIGQAAPHAGTQGTKRLAVWPVAFLLMEFRVSSFEFQEKLQT